MFIHTLTTYFVFKTICVLCVLNIIFINFFLSLFVYIKKVCIFAYINTYKNGY